jgi:hypothetical protein
MYGKAPYLIATRVLPLVCCVSIMLFAGWSEAREGPLGIKILILIAAIIAFVGMLTIRCRACKQLIYSSEVDEYQSGEKTFSVFKCSRCGADI